MMIFEDLEFHFINILVALVSIIIIYFAWKSTNVREDRLPPTAVLIIENNRRRLLENIVRPQVSQVQRESTENLQIPRPNYIQEVIDEVTDSAVTSVQTNNYQTVQQVDSVNNLLVQNDNETDQQRIVNDMDNTDTAEGLRRRRVAFYAHDNPSAESPNDATTNIDEGRSVRQDLNLQTGDSAHADNCSNENNENENISKSEENRMQGEPLKPTKATAPPIAEPENELNEEFRIKLKYLNDDLRLVKGCPNEEIGDFKKRNFTVELAAQKLVRLVFNGHVLQPDSKTLRACGLFDNCVVHCLVHKKPSPAANTPENSNNQGANRNQQRGGQNETIRNIGGSTFLDGNTNGPFFLYFGVAMLTLAIIFCWYCRIQYSSLFSLYSTIGLVLVTALFLIIFPLVILIERDVSS